MIRACLPFFLMVSSLAYARNQSAPPNIVIFLADDLGKYKVRKHKIMYRLGK